MKLSVGLLTRELCLQAFVSEYAVTGKDAGTGSLLASLAEAAFLIGLEKNRFPSTFLWIVTKNINRVKV